MALHLLKALKQEKIKIACIIFFGSLFLMTWAFHDALLVIQAKGHWPGNPTPNNDILLGIGAFIVAIFASAIVLIT